MALQCLKGAHKQEGNQPLTWVGSGFKLQERRSRIAVGEVFHGEAVDAPIPTAVQGWAGLGGDVGNLI